MQPLGDTADDFLARVRSRGARSEDVTDGVALLERLKQARDFGRLGDLAEALAREAPDNAQVRGLYAQALIETGRSAAAIAVLEAALARSSDAGARAELSGLLGRANKQIFMDAADRSSDAARAALEAAVEAYRAPFTLDPRKYWHGINLAAVIHAAQRAGIERPPELDPDAIARKVLDVLDELPPAERDAWWSATKGEAHLALGHWSEAEQAYRTYVEDALSAPFNFASTLRQLRDVWEIHRQPRGAGLLQLLEARLAELHDVPLRLRPAHVRTMRGCAEPSSEQRERVLGDINAQPLRWYRQALDCAASVAAVRHIAGKRFGTAFAVRASDVGWPSDETLVLTNYHVVNRDGAEGGNRCGDAEIVFEAAAQQGLGPYTIAGVVAESPLTGGLDYALLRLDTPADLPPPIPVTLNLPLLGSEPPSRVSIIGHPDADELHLALEDNRLLDHEGDPDGAPPDRARRRVHYFTPTSKGNSGSPVFDVSWRVIALHHFGARYAPLASQLGLPRLNGKAGTYSANEGIWIGSVRADVASKAPGGR